MRLCVALLAGPLKETQHSEQPAARVAQGQQLGVKAGRGHSVSIDSGRGQVYSAVSFDSGQLFTVAAPTLSSEVSEGPQRPTRSGRVCPLPEQDRKVIVSGRDQGADPSPREMSVTTSRS